MTAQKWIPPIAIALIGVEAGLALAYLAMVYGQGEALPLLDLNGLRSLPSWLQAAHLFAIGGLCLGLLRFRQRMARPVSWFLPSAVGAGGASHFSAGRVWCRDGQGCDRLRAVYPGLLQRPVPG